MKVMDPGQVNGGVTSPATFANWTEIAAFNAGSTAQSSVGGGGGTGMASPKCFTISMQQDKMAYYLKKEMFIADALASIQVDFARFYAGTPLVYYRVQMENVYVTAIEEASVAGDPVTMNVSFVPEKFRYTYWPTNANGSLSTTPVIFGWNVSTMQQW
jgi:type VI protein secretion system component Hcp